MPQDLFSGNEKMIMTPESFGLHFGLSQKDLDRFGSWLESEGFTIDDIPAGHWMIVFSGTVAQVESTFQVKIGNYQIVASRVSFSPS
jgi:subtilase family serine protease